MIEPGAQIDHYEIVRPIGRGGMGAVFLARDTKLGRKVALKLVSPESLGDESATKRFLEEARLTAKFSHPHIVTIYGVGEVRGHPYLALEYLQGQSLGERLDERPPGSRESLRLSRPRRPRSPAGHPHPPRSCTARFVSRGAPPRRPPP